MVIRGLKLLVFSMLVSSCTTTYPNRDPLGERFPQVQGTALSGTKHVLPDDFAGDSAILMVGYTQRSQFDIDRWILGLVQLGTPARLVEVPTIPGIFPGLFAEKIDSGMRKGIPMEDWASVITVYDEAEPIVMFFGNENKNNARVALLNGKGEVVWFTDRGYSAGQVKALHDKAVQLRDSESPAKSQVHE